MDLRLIQFLSQCRDEEDDVINRSFHEPSLNSWTTTVTMRVARGTTQLANLLGTTESVANNA